MNHAASSLLRRLASLFATASFASDAHSTSDAGPQPTSGAKDDINLSQVGVGKTNKLIFGTIRKGIAQLAQHSSHSSHSSHYSSSSGSSNSTPAAPSTDVATPDQVPTPTPPSVFDASQSRSGQTPTQAGEMSQIEIITLADVFRKLPKIRSKWPQEAILKTKCHFNLRDGDKVVGIIELDAGTKVKVLEIKLQHAIVRVGATESPLPVTKTDIIERMGGTAKILAYPDDPQPKPENDEQKKAPVEAPAKT